MKFKLVISLILGVFFGLVISGHVKQYIKLLQHKYHIEIHNSESHCKDKYEINSKNYWDCRFKTQDWQNNHGDDQTLHFYTLLVNAIPESIQDEINSNGLSVVDFGCAQGEGTEYFAKVFPKAKVTGADVSSEGIEIAKRKNKKASFIATDLTKSKARWDILISSNTLEHFHQPWSVVEKLSDKIRKYIIILVPFEQPGIPIDEHFYSFNNHNIPQVINNFKLQYTKLLYPDPKYWGEKQILMIYSNVN